MDAPARQLIFHGAVVLLVGLLLGAPYGRAVNRQAPAHVVNSWRVAHASLPVGALVMLAVGAVVSALPVQAAIKWVIAGSFVVSSYAFCISLPLAAIVGHRGLSPGGPLSARVVYGGNVIGAIASLAGALAFVWAAFLAL
jgi:hypothetical protein